MAVCAKTNVISIKILWGAQKRHKRAHKDMRPIVADDPSLKLIQITLMPTNCTMLPKLLSSLFRRCPWNWERKILISNFIFTQISIMFISFSYLTFSRVFAHNIKPFKKCSLGLKTATILGVVFHILLLWSISLLPKWNAYHGYSRMEHQRVNNKQSGLNPQWLVVNTIKETHGRRHQKLETGYQWTQNGPVSTKFFF